MFVIPRLPAPPHPHTRPEHQVKKRGGLLVLFDPHAFWEASSHTRLPFFTFEPRSLERQGKEPLFLTSWSENVCRVAAAAVHLGSANS